MITGTYVVHMLDTVDQADRIVEFFFSPYSFDDTRYTPGEEEQLRSLPYRALSGQVAVWYVTNETDEIIGVSCVAENRRVQLGLCGRSSRISQMGDCRRTAQTHG